MDVHGYDHDSGDLQDAFYHYDTESEPSRFLRQRRRWYNGMLAALHMDILCPLSWRWLWGSGRPWYIRLMNVLVLTEEYLLVVVVMRSAVAAALNC